MSYDPFAESLKPILYGECGLDVAVPAESWLILYLSVGVHSSFLLVD